MMKCILVVSMLLPITSWAFDSTCLVDGEACEGGPQAARSPWIDGGGAWPTSRVKDEHRRIFLGARLMGGLPESLDEPLELLVFTNGEEVTTSTGDWPSLRSVPLHQAQKMEVRRKTIAEFAQLPDHGYGLWDWASGFETCPLSTANEGNIETTACHSFTTHMGPVNSNHFPPQAEDFFKHYHNLALDRAEVCAQMADQVPELSGAALDAVLSCEKQALVIEAIAQHYLQDLWSSGHMWHRWGSTDLNDFESRTQAMVVASIAGLIHGSEALIGQPDAMCSPDENVWHVTYDGDLGLGLGDLYLHELQPVEMDEPDYLTQYNNLLSCTVHSLREVYGRTAQAHGDMTDPVYAGLWTPQPDWSDCTGQRATNKAMNEGLSIAVPAGASVITLLTMSNMLLQIIVASVSSAFGDIILSPADLARLTVDLIRFEAVTTYYSQYDPYGTQIAKMPPNLMGVRPNHEYRSTPIAPYVDPALPWPNTPDLTPDAEERSADLAMTFREAHAADWCQETTLDDLERLRTRAQNPNVDRDTACEACAVAAWHHLRIGASGDYDADREPLCHWISDQPVYLYESDAGGLDTRSLARKWCGCSYGKIGALAINETHYLWALDPNSSPPRVVSPCDGNRAELQVDLGGGMQPVGASRMGGDEPGVFIRFAPLQYVGWVDTAECEEADLDDDVVTSSPNAPFGTTRFEEPNGMEIMGVVGHVTESGERYMIYAARYSNIPCFSELVVVNMDGWEEVRRLDYPGNPTELMVVNDAPAISEGASLLISMTGDLNCFRAEVQGLAIEELLDPEVTPERQRFIFGGSGTQAPRRMAVLSEQKLAAVTLGEDQGHIGVMDLVTGDVSVLAPGIRIADPLQNPTDVIGWAESDDMIRWTFGQTDSADRGGAVNGCIQDFGPCPALRTISWDAEAREEVEVGVEWQGPPYATLNYTIENTPDSNAFVVAHHRILVTVLKHLPGIHAFAIKEVIAGPGGTGVLFPYLY